MTTQISSTTFYDNELHSLNNLPDKCPLNLLPYGLLSEMIIPLVKELKRKYRDEIIDRVVKKLGLKKMKYVLQDLNLRDKNNIILNLDRKVSLLNTRKNMISLIKKFEIPPFYLLNYERKFMDKPQLRLGDAVRMTDMCGSCQSRTIEGIITSIDKDMITIKTFALIKTSKYKSQYSSKCVYNHALYESSYGISHYLGPNYSTRSYRNYHTAKNWKCELLPKEPLHRVLLRESIERINSMQFNINRKLYKEIRPQILEDDYCKNLTQNEFYNMKRAFVDIFTRGGCDLSKLETWENIEIFSINRVNLSYRNYTECEVKGLTINYTESYHHLLFIIDWMKRYLRN